MKKRIVIPTITLLISTLLLSACNTQTVIKTNEEKYGYTAFPGTDWGMSVEECMNSLGLKEDDVEIKTGVDNDDPNSSVLTTSIKFMEKPCSVSFVFSNKADNVDYGFGLMDVTATFINEKTLNDFTKIENEFKDQISKKALNYSLGAGGSFSTQGISLESEISIFDLEASDVKTHALDIIDKTSEGSETLVISRTRRAITSIGINYFDKDNETYNSASIIVAYHGLPVAILNTAEKQLEAEKSK